MTPSFYLLCYYICMPKNILFNFLETILCGFYWFLILNLNTMLKSYFFTLNRWFIPFNDVYVNLFIHSLWMAIPLSLFLSLSQLWGLLLGAHVHMSLPHFCRVTLWCSLRSGNADSWCAWYTIYKIQPYCFFKVIVLTYIPSSHILEILSIYSLTKPGAIQLFKFSKPMFSLSVLMCICLILVNLWPFSIFPPIIFIFLRSSVHIFCPHSSGIVSLFLSDFQIKVFLIFIF